MKRFILCTIILISAIPLFAKATVIKGTTRYASNKETIPYCTISLCEDDSTHTVIRKFPSSDVGYFEVSVDVESKKRYCLIFEAIGLEITTKCIEVHPNGKEINLGNIDIKDETTSLAEVKVVAQKPLVKMEIDRLAYDTESDPETKTSNALDMLRKVPLVTVDGEDKIQVKGSDNFKIYINGKPSAMVSRNPEDVFRSLPASTIKRIEVITDPGAKYEAEGLTGILNIITYHSLIGYNGSVNIGADIWGDANVGGYITTKIGKFGISANLSYNTDNNPGSYGYSSRTNLSDQAGIQHTNNSNSMNMRSHNMYGSLELSYEFDSVNLLSLSAGGWYGNNTSRGKNNQQFWGKDSLLVSEYDMRSTSFSSYSGFNANLDYQHTFKKPDQNLTASYRYSGSPSTLRSENSIHPILNYIEQQQRNKSVSNGSEHTFQLDYTEPWANKMHTMEVGIKYILRLNTSRNSNELFDSITNQWISHPMIDDNNLNQMQHILGAYAGYTFRYKWFSLRAGTRLEHTTQHVTVTDTILRPQYTNVVPSLSVSFKLATTQNLSISYTQRLYRPGIWYLNPYWDNTDPLNISQGNPNLNVERSHNISISYGLFTPKFNMNISTWGAIMNNSISSIQTQLSDSITYTTYANIGQEMSVGGNIYLNWMMGKVARWTINANIFYNYFDARNIESLNRTTSSWRCGVHSSLQFFLPWKLRLGFDGGYWSPYSGLQTKSSAHYYYSASLQRAFLKERLNVRLKTFMFAEPYQHFRSTTTTDFYTQTSEVSTRGASFNITISYSFGEMREQIRRVNKSITNDDVKSNG